ncbi:CPBP family intramembrane glutamic endopeptidase [Amycolatopsis sp. lyj-109]|uniref:CPBP family intramembrane glutamic endopeptidase n=1 Tax=Amycolatopsis sp. lyj-109 TaxID=2789287 RepID=UPI00397C3ECA
MSTPTGRVATVPFLLGFLALYAVLVGLAELDATGRYGIGILTAVALMAIAVEWRLDRTGPLSALRGLGLGRPDGRAVLIAVGVAVLIQGVYPLVGFITGATLTLKPGWPWLLLGIFAFHGLAEELVWRGYAFGRLRRGRSFAKAVAATMPLVAATHLPVIVTSGLTVGVAAMLVAAITSLPLAHLFEKGRNTLWAPAIVHTGIDTFKLVTIPDEARQVFSLTLAAVSLTIPLLALAYRARPRPNPTATPTQQPSANS